MSRPIHRDCPLWFDHLVERMKAQQVKPIRQIVCANPDNPTPLTGIFKDQVDAYNKSREDNPAQCICAGLEVLLVKQTDQADQGKAASGEHGDHD